MPKPIRASDVGLETHYKVRVCGHGWVVHLASWNEPEVAAGKVIEADWIQDHRYGDTPGYITWSEVVAVTWRKSE